MITEFNPLVSFAFPWKAWTQLGGHKVHSSLPPFSICHGRIVLRSSRLGTKAAALATPSRKICDTIPFCSSCYFPLLEALAPLESCVFVASSTSLRKSSSAINGASQTVVGWPLTWVVRRWP
jgi:hypothetical protein